MQASKDLVSELLLVAEQGKHRQFQFLTNWSEYSNAKKLRRTYRLVVASIKQSADAQFKKYCKDIAAGESDVVKLLAYNATVKVMKFYKEELSIISDMIYEYEAYLMEDGNLAFTLLFNEQRPTSRLYDHRS